MISLENYLEHKYSTSVVRTNKQHIERYKLTLGQRAEKATYSEVMDYIGLLRMSETVVPVAVCIPKH